jgi:membrane-associated phospholipid phosphatase
LRSGALHFLRLNDLEGLITFPSFHTTGGLLFAWALLKTPYLRWPALAINGALIASTPVVGAHYFIDLVGGAAVAAISLFASQRLYHASAPRRPATSPELGALQQAEENVSP